MLKTLNKKQTSKGSSRFLSVLFGVFGGVFGVLTAFFVSRPLGSELYGRVQYYVSVVNALSLLLSFGLPFYLVKVAQKANNPPKLLGSSLLLFDLVSGCVFPVYFLIAYFLLSTLSKNIFLILLIFAAAFFVSLSSILSSYFLGLKKIVIYQLVYSFLPKALLCIASIIAVFFLDKTTFVALYIPVFIVVYFLSSVPFLVKSFSFSRPSFSKNDVKTLLIFVVSSLTTTISSYLAKIIQGDFYSNLAILGVFSLSMQILTAGVLFCSIISKLSQPFFAELASKTPEENINYFRKILRLNSSFAIPFCIALATESKNVLSFFGGESFAAHPLVLMISSFAVLIEVVVGPINVFLSMGGHEKFLLINGLVNVFLLSVLSIFLSFITDYGVPISYLVTSFCVSVMGLIEVRVIYKMPPVDFKTILFLLFQLALSFGIFACLGLISKTSQWLLLNILAGLFLILFFLIFSPFKEDTNTFPFLKEFKIKIQKMCCRFFFKKRQSSCFRLRFTRFFNFVYLLTGLLFISNVVLMGTDKIFFVFYVNSFEITPRMIIAAVFLLEFLLSLFINRNIRLTESFYLRYFTLIGLLCIFSFVMGVLVNGLALALVDIKSLVYLVLVFPFFDLFELKLISHRWFFTFFSIVSLAMSVFLLCFHFYLQVKNISRFEINSYFVHHLGNTGFAFREGFAVYQGGLLFPTLLIPVYSYFLLFKKNSPKQSIFYFVCGLADLAAVFQSKTRGFELFVLVFISFLIPWKLISFIVNTKRLGGKILTPKSVGAFIGLFLIIFAGLWFVISKGYLNRLFEGDENSDSTRFSYMAEVFPKLLISPILFGKFLGYTIDSAVNWHIETSLLEIFLKQGFVGFIAWILPPIFLCKSKTRFNHSDVYWALLLVVLGLYFTSLFNPYLWNYGGITILILSLGLDEQYKQKVSLPTIRHQRI